MIITLEIQDKRPKKLLQKLKAVFRPCEINARIKKQNKISVLQLTYKLYRGRPDMKKLAPFLVGCGDTIVCSKNCNINIAPYKRFENGSFAQVMMLNFVKDILARTDISPLRIKIAYYDPMGRYPYTAEALLEYCPGLTVVTNTPKFYETFSERLSEESGCSLIVSNTIDSLRDCDILLCSEAPDIHFPLSDDTIVFYASQPQIKQNGTSVYEYKTAVPYKYQRVRPEYIDEFSFLSALYTLCGVKELENLVPSAGADGEDIYTAERLVSRLTGVSRSA